MKKRFTRKNIKYHKNIFGITRTLARINVCLKNKKGFTLVELLVVLAIMGVMLGVVFTNNKDFEVRSKFKNAVYDTALDIRETQVKGISASDEEGNPMSSEFFHSFGVHFELGDSGYIVYQDIKDGDRWYSKAPKCNVPSDNEECIKSVVYSSDYSIDDLCVTSFVGVESCGVSELDISYLRPNINSDIVIDKFGISYSSAKIKISNGSGLIYIIHVAYSGHVYYVE